MKEAIDKFNSSREEFVRKRNEAWTKINSFQEKIHHCREKFEKKRKEARADIENVRKIWREMSKKFRWWGTIP